MSQQQEFELQLSIAEYMKVVYPHAQFRSDLGGIRLHPKSARKVKQVQKSRGFPDFFICKMAGRYGGLFLEFKLSRDDVFIKDGSRLISGNSTHILEQCAVLAELKREGYAVGLAYGYYQIVDVIDAYMDGQYGFNSQPFKNIWEAINSATEEQWLKAQVGSEIDLSVLKETANALFP